MRQCLMDTNTVSDYFFASFEPAGMTFMDVVMDAQPNISDIAQIELRLLKQYFLCFISC